MHRLVGARIVRVRVPVRGMDDIIRSRVFHSPLVVSPLRPITDDPFITPRLGIRNLRLSSTQIPVHGKVLATFTCLHIFAEGKSGKRRGGEEGHGQLDSQSQASQEAAADLADHLAAFVRARMGSPVRMMRHTDTLTILE